MNRRELLQLFGVGAVVAPVIGGLVSSVSAQARIIEPAKVEIIEAPELMICEDLPWGKVAKIHVDILIDTGERYHMDCQSISQSVEWYGNPAHRQRRLTMELFGPDLPVIVGAREHMGYPRR